MQIPMERRTQLLMSFSCLQKWPKEKQNQNRSVQGSDYETLGLRSAASLLNFVNTLKPTFSNAGMFVFRHLSLKTLVFISVHLWFLQQHHGRNQLPTTKARVKTDSYACNCAELPTWMGPFNIILNNRTGINSHLKSLLLVRVWTMLV